MRTIARILLYDVLLALVYIACDAYLAYFYFSQNDFWWGLLTLLAVALPGTLGLQISKLLSYYCLYILFFRVFVLHILLVTWRP